MKATSRLRTRALAAVGVFALLTVGTVGAGQASAVGADAAGTVTYTVVDLGTLGGTASNATAIDGDTVVGSSSTTGNTTTHAFSYNLRTHRTTDIGALGSLGSTGSSSTATAVDGSLVLGSSHRPGDPATYAFVYDLRTRRVTGISGLGGSSTSLVGVTGHTLVGTSTTAGDAQTRAFSYDLRTGARTDLGSLDGPSGNSYATGVSGSYVVGDSTPAGNPPLARRGFVYDLRTHRTTDIGSLGGTFTRVYGISGHTVVGQSQSTVPGYGGLAVFSYDLRTRLMSTTGPGLKISPLISGNTIVGSDSLIEYSYSLRTHTTTVIGPGIGVTQANGINGNLVVGDVFAANSFAFAYRISSNSFTRLPALGGLNSTANQSNRAGVVVGSAALTPPDPYTANGPYHAAVWVPHRS
ncbi:hypothetical protein [Streptacidiphilus sp. PAMC 29251]